MRKISWDALCAEDGYSGKTYSHRNAWLPARLQTVREIFAVDICAYVVMSEYDHLVNHGDKERAGGW